MGYGVSFEIKEAYLEVHVVGDRMDNREAEDGLDVISRVVDCCYFSKKTRVLLICNLPGPLPVLQAWEFGHRLEVQTWRFMKVALVHLDRAARISNEFTETVVRNRGYNWKLFGDAPEAKEWLLTSDQSSDKLTYGTSSTPH